MRVIPALFALLFGQPCPAHQFAVIGDSNVASWDLGPGCLNLGVGGNTSQMMARRFDPVAAAKFKTLVIWATTNDAGHKFGARYYREIVERAHAKGLRVVLVTPVKAGDLTGQIVALGRSEGIPVAAVHVGPEWLSFHSDHQHINRFGHWLAWRSIKSEIPRSRP